MTPFSKLSAAIQAKLQTMELMTGVALIQEDAGDVPTMIEKHVGRVGMGALLGTPGFGNEDPLCNVINGRIKVDILFMEVPALWRKTADKPHCCDLAQAAGAELQGLAIDGFEPLRVLRGEPVADKEIGPVGLYRLELETMQIFDAS